MGSVSRMVVPGPSCGASAMEPWWRWTISLAMESPRPVPPDSRERALSTPVEPVEDPVPVLFRDADAVIADLHPHLILGGTGSDADMTAVRSVFDGIAQNVHHDLFQPAAVAHDERKVLQRAAGELVTVPLGLQGIGTVDALDGVGEGKAGEVQLCVAGIRAGRASEDPGRCGSSGRSP